MLSLERVLLLFNPALWARVAATLTIGCSLLVPVGWALHIPILKSGVPGAAEMKPNTAVSLIVLSICLILLELSLANDPRQVDTLAELKRQVDAHFDRMSAMLALHQLQGADGARDAITIGGAADAVATIHGLLDGMDRIEEGLLDKRRQDAERARIQTLLALLMTLAVVSVLLVVLFRSIRRALLARQQTEHEILRLNTELEGRVEQRTRALTRQEEMNRLLVENLAEGVAVCDAQGRLTSANRTCRQWYEEDVGTGEKAAAMEEWGSRYGIYEPDGVTPLPTQRIPLVRALRGEQIHNVEISEHRLADGRRLAGGGAR